MFENELHDIKFDLREIDSKREKQLKHSEMISNFHAYASSIPNGIMLADFYRIEIFGTRQ